MKNCLLQVLVPKPHSLEKQTPHRGSLERARQLPDARVLPSPSLLCMAPPAADITAGKEYSAPCTRVKVSPGHGIQYPLGKHVGPSSMSERGTSAGVPLDSTVGILNSDTGTSQNSQKRRFQLYCL